MTAMLDTKSPEFKMAKAKSALILEQPFYAALVCNMPWERDDSVPTMCTNGDWVKWSAKFVDALTLDEVKFVICHEIMHVVWMHCFRRGARDPYVWNQATDYVINNHLITDNIGSMPKGGLHNPQLVQQCGGLAEKVYDLLPVPPPGGGKGGGKGNGHGDPLDDCQDNTGSEAEQQERQAEIKVRVAQAAQAAKMCGKLSGALREFVDEILTPKVNWKDVLRRFASSKAKIEPTFARPKRRFAGEDIYLPSMAGESLGEMVVAVDCSGSVGERELQEFANEIRAIHEDLHPSKMHILYFHTKVFRHETFGPDDHLTITAGETGGTAFSPIFKAVDKAGIEPACLVVLTDLCCSDFGPVPDYPVLWVSTYPGKAPWGEVVMMNPM